jgi:hypothetical protein
LGALLQNWNDLERSLDIEVPLSTFAWRAAADDAYERAVGVARPQGINARLWRASQITGMLWPRGTDAREAGLRARNLFHELPTTERLLVERGLRRRIGEMPWQECGAAVAPDGALARDAVVDITAPSQEVRELRRALLAAGASKVETGAVLLSPSVTAIRRAGGAVVARLAIEGIA